MKCRLKKRPEATGHTMGLNKHSMSEVIVGFDDREGAGGDMDSCFGSELEVQLRDGRWKELYLALNDRDVVVNNMNWDFREPMSEEEKKRGYYD
jgi:hypothetical protein